MIFLAVNFFRKTVPPSPRIS